MRSRQRFPLPRIVMLAGFALAVAGAILLGLTTFQTQTTVASSSLGPAQVTLTLTHPGLDPTTVALFAVLLVFPIGLSFVRWKFYLTTVVAPALVALYMSVWIYRNQLGGGAIASSETWVFLGDALILLGCALEIYGIVWERFRRVTGEESVPLRPSRVDAGH